MLEHYTLYVYLLLVYMHSGCLPAVFIINARYVAVCYMLYYARASTLYTGIGW